jgi:threonine dehydrogenase-like Zn-dependent dehydrogenase
MLMQHCLNQLHAQLTVWRKLRQRYPSKICRLIQLGSSVLMIGAGPTGLVLAQLLKQNGGCHVTLAANAGIKMELAQKLEAADEFIFLDRKTPEKQWAQIKTDNPYVSPLYMVDAGIRYCC